MTVQIPALRLRDVLRNSRRFLGGIPLGLLGLVLRAVIPAAWVPLRSHTAVATFDIAHGVTSFLEVALLYLWPALEDC